MKGQTFMLGTIIFIGVIFTTFTLVDEDFSLQDSESITREYFSHSLDTTGEAYSEALKESDDILDWKRRVYSHENNIRSFSESRNINYSSYILLFRPGKGETLFINYADFPRKVNLSVNGDELVNTEVESNQWFETSFEPGKANISLEVDNSTHERTKFNPGFIKNAVMEAEDERWSNTIK